MYFEGRHRRTYVAYMDHHFDARITYYDHDVEQWVEPVRVDNCIAEVGWCKGIKDGHNVPNLWISTSGTIHLVYGSHGTPFKYARSERPEDITRWKLGKRLSNHATYPFFTQLPDGEMLMFYRYGPKGSYTNPFLGLQRTADEGLTWSRVKKIGAFRKACKLNGKNVIYDPATGRIHLNLALMPEGRWVWFPCQYDPAADRMYSWNGTTDLGRMPGDDQIVKHCLVDGLSLREIFLHDGALYMLLKRGDAHSFAEWDGKKLTRYDIPDADTKGFNNGPMWTTDGKTIRIYGVRNTDPPTPFRGGDLYVWTSTDGGQHWDQGRCLIDRRDLGHGLLGVNLVMGYAGSGPFLLAAEVTGKYPKDFKITPANHYDNPWRKNKKLYALDEQGRFVRSR